MKNYFMLDGKEIPMSNETADSLRETQKKKVMVESLVFTGETRIILYLTDKMKEKIAEYSKDYVFSFDPRGILCNHGDGSHIMYEGIPRAVLFEGDLT